MILSDWLSPNPPDTADPSNKLPLLKSSFGLLANQLRQEDRVGIVVVYAGNTGVVLKST